VIWHIIEDALKNSILISGLVVIMMMLIELFNVRSGGKFFAGLKNSRWGGILSGALLGVIPGCMGGFATVSLYTHGMLSFGALVAMMIASSGDEAFVMLAAFPEKALLIFALLLVIAIVAGFLVDLFVRQPVLPCCEAQFTVHEQAEEHSEGRHLSWKRVLMFLGVAVFLAALALGGLEHSHEGPAHHDDEAWMNIMFAVFGILVLVVLVLGSDHFVEEHLWHHIVVRHLPRIFAWTFGVLLLLGAGMHYFNIDSWISDNTALMILLATVIGIIPESGPHLIFVTLYASGVIPLPVLLASCISQDGHASIPLLAESKKAFVKAKAINCIVALAVGYAAWLI